MKILAQFLRINKIIPHTFRADSALFFPAVTALDGNGEIGQFSFTGLAVTNK